MSKVLIIEDDPFLLKLYKEILSEAGIETEESVDGETGLKKVKDRKPDLILLDIMLPKMNGLEVLEKLKEGQSSKDIPVIIITNLASEEDKKRANDLGAVRYMIKTEYEPDQVVALVKEILRQ
jgi:DNA-binding response OmpR family regulator